MTQPTDKNEQQQDKETNLRQSQRNESTQNDDKKQNNREKFSPGEPDDYDAEEFSTD